MCSFDLSRNSDPATEPDRLKTQGERVLLVLKGHPEGLSGRGIERLVAGAAREVRQAIRMLKATGKISSARRRRPGGGVIWKLGAGPNVPCLAERRAASRPATEKKVLAVLGEHPEGLSGRRLEELVGGSARESRAVVLSLREAGTVSSAARTERGGGILWKLT